MHSILIEKCLSSPQPAHTEPESFIYDFEAQGADLDIECLKNTIVQKGYLRLSDASCITIILPDGPRVLVDEMPASSLETNPSLLALVSNTPDEANHIQTGGGVNVAPVLYIYRTDELKFHCKFPESIEGADGSTWVSGEIPWSASELDLNQRFTAIGFNGELVDKELRLMNSSDSQSPDVPVQLSDWSAGRLAPIPLCRIWRSVDLNARNSGQSAEPASRAQSAEPDALSSGQSTDLNPRRSPELVEVEPIDGGLGQSTDFHVGGPAPSADLKDCESDKPNSSPSAEPVGRGQSAEPNDGGSIDLADGGASESTDLTSGGLSQSTDFNDGGDDPSADFNDRESDQTDELNGTLSAAPIGRGPADPTDGGLSQSTDFNDGGAGPSADLKDLESAQLDELDGRGSSPLVGPNFWTRGQSPDPNQSAEFDSVGPTPTVDLTSGGTADLPDDGPRQLDDLIGGGPSQSGDDSPSQEPNNVGQSTPNNGQGPSPSAEPNGPGQSAEPNVNGPTSLAEINSRGQSPESDADSFSTSAELHNRGQSPEPDGDAEGPIRSTEINNLGQSPEPNGDGPSTSAEPRNCVQPGGPHGHGQSSGHKSRAHSMEPKRRAQSVEHNARVKSTQPVARSKSAEPLVRSKLAEPAARGISPEPEPNARSQSVGPSQSDDLNTQSVEHNDCQSGQPAEPSDSGFDHSAEPYACGSESAEINARGSGQSAEPDGSGSGKSTQLNGRGSVQSAEPSDSGFDHSAEPYACGSESAEINARGSGQSAEPDGSGSGKSTQLNGRGSVQSADLNGRGSSEDLDSRSSGQPADCNACVPSPDLKGYGSSQLAEPNNSNGSGQLVLLLKKQNEQFEIVRRRYAQKINYLKSVHAALQEEVQSEISTEKEIYEDLVKFQGADEVVTQHTRKVIDEIKEKLLKSVTCSKCSKPYASDDAGRNPVHLSCGHVFCKRCLRYDWLDRAIDRIKPTYRCFHECRNFDPRLLVDNPHYMIELMKVWKRLSEEDMAAETSGSRASL